MKKLFYFLGIVLLGVSCNQNKSVESSYEVRSEVKAKAELIAGATQKELMKNVSGAIQKGGTFYAVEYCNTAAIPLTDSMAQNHKVHISRLTEKTRNPDNNLKTKIDKAVYNTFLKNKSVIDSLVEDSNSFTYYKRIDLGMSTCLACHGNPEEIEPQTLAKIKKLFPADKATGYALDDFRGMWMIEMQK